MAEYLWHLHDRRVHYDVIRQHSASISMSCFTATDGAIQQGHAPSVTNTLKVLRQKKPSKKKGLENYADPVLLYQEAWLYGPPEALTVGHMKEVAAILCAADTGCRPSDLSKLFRVFDGQHRQIEFTDYGMRLRFFFPKEVDPGSSRRNATNYYFSKWIQVHSTTPLETSTPEVLRHFMEITSGPEFGVSHISELDVDAQSLFYGKKTDGVWGPASVDHIANLIKNRMRAAGMGNMTARSLRGASPSKIVQLFPSALQSALALGRWTSAFTFHTHYQGKVNLVSSEPPPPSLESNPQQILRWGFKPNPPPGVSPDEYMKRPDHWVGQSFPDLGTVQSFSEGVYTVAEQHNQRSQICFYHYELMAEISKSRCSSGSPT